VTSPFQNLIDSLTIQAPLDDSAQEERLYHLLPAFYRDRDQQQGEPLRALLAIAEDELQHLEWEIDAAYDNWFIETCDDWAVPYLADLVGVQGLIGENQRLFDQRRRVANTIRYHRRSGISGVLENALKDVTGRYTYVAEYQQRIAATQHMAHIRPQMGTVDVRQLMPLALLGTPFESFPRTGRIPHESHSQLERQDIAHVHYHPAGIGIFLWRLHYYPVDLSAAYNVETAGVDCFTFSPVGGDVPLHVRPQLHEDVERRAQIINLPGAITRAQFAADLQDYREHHSKDEYPVNTVYYGPDRSFSVIWPSAANSRFVGDPASPFEIISADLSDWSVDLVPLLLADQVAAGRAVAIDVELGRIKFYVNEEITGKSWIRKSGNFVGVSYTYGFGGDIGGGPYDRQDSLQALPGDAAGDFYAAVSKNGGDEPVYRTLQKALEMWDLYCADHPNPTGTIEFLDNGRYGGALPDIHLPVGARLTIKASDGKHPTVVTPSPIHPWRVVSDSEGTELFIHGLLVRMPLIFKGGIDVHLEHCTVMVAEDQFVALQVEGTPTANLRFTLKRCITGQIRLPSIIRELAIEESIIDGGFSGGIAIQGSGDQGSSGPDARLDCTTILGQVHLRCLLHATNTIFDGDVTAESFGEVSHCCFATDLTVTDSQNKPALSTSNVRNVPPDFTSMRYGDPGYGQLSLRCPTAIWRGADDGAEMGVFHYLYQPQREDNIPAILEEYLPLGFDVDLYFVS